MVYPKVAAKEHETVVWRVGYLVGEKVGMKVAL